MNRHETVAAGIEAAAHGALLDKETLSCNGRLRRTGPLEVAKAPGRQTVTSASDTPVRAPRQRCDKDGAARRPHIRSAHAAHEAIQTRGAHVLGRIGVGVVG